MSSWQTLCYSHLEEDKAMRKDPVLVSAILLLAAFYSASFFLPVLDTDIPVRGWEIFLLCLQFIISNEDGNSGRALLAWLPNPLLWAGILCLWTGRPRMALVFG